MSKQPTEYFSQGLAPFSGLASVMAKLVVNPFKAKGDVDEADAGEIYADDRDEVDDNEVGPPTPLGTKAVVDFQKQNNEVADADFEAVLDADAPLPVEAEDVDTQEEGEATAPAAVARTLPYPDVDPKAAKLAMSACLMGEEVRYNGGHCRARGIMEGMKAAFTFVPVCPEIDIGLGVPRPTLRLVAGAKLSRDMDLEDIHKSVQLWCPEKGQDYTEAMDSYTTLKVAELRAFGVDGFILKRDSPSCGIDRVKLYETTQEKSMGMKLYRGLFARGLMKEWPELPVTDEGRLTEEDTRNNFVASVICHQRWRAHDQSFKAVVNFHANHKYTLMVQSPKLQKELGQELAKGPKFFKANDFAKVYYAKFFAAMKIMVGRGRHTNVLFHLVGHLRNSIDPELYKDLLGCVSDYQEGMVPLVVPLHLLQVYSKSGKVSDEDSGKYLLSISSYVQSAPRSLRAHTSISNRTVSKLPIAAGGDVAIIHKPGKA